MLTVRDLITSHGRRSNFQHQFDLMPDEIKDQYTKNGLITIAKVSLLCSQAGFNDPLIDSGWRPESYNKLIGGSKNSAHLTCQAVDIWDPDKVLGEWCMNNIEALKEIGLYMESLVVTHASEDRNKRWVHLSIRAPASGDQVFMP